MEFDKHIEKLFEADMSADEFTAALGDEDDRAKVKADMIKRKFMKLWDEYVSEAEHQDGYAFWDNFNSLKSIAQDLVMYAEYFESRK